MFLESLESNMHHEANCDAICENLSDVTKQHFEKWIEIVRKLVYNSTDNRELLNII